MVYCIIGLFIAHTLILSGDYDRRFCATYPVYFDTAWKLTLQLLLTALFVGIFWLVLELGGSVFRLIDVEYFSILLSKNWFYIPATTLAIAIGIHLTDVHSGMIRGLRTIILLLFSWLLPLVVLIVGGFLVTLIAAKVQYARDDAEIYLSMACALIIFINATYQDGTYPFADAFSVRKWSATIGAQLLLPLMLLSACGLYRRINQNGWLPLTVQEVGIFLIICSYSLGYGYAAVFGRRWLKFIEVWNFVVALLILAVFLALNSPLADPLKISAKSQLHRIKLGIAPNMSSYYFLQGEAGRFGTPAITIKMPRQNMRNVTSTYQMLSFTDKKKKFFIHTSNQAYLESFLQQNLAATYIGTNISHCVDNDATTCHIWLQPITGSNKSDILLLVASDGLLYLLHQNAENLWQLQGFWKIPYACRSAREKVANGDYKFVPAKVNDMEIGGRRFTFESLVKCTN
jgi:hypothetical protein